MSQAAFGNHVACMELLKEADADLHSLDLHGLTPLIAAAQNGSLEGCKFLYNHGANINHTTNDGPEKTSALGIALIMKQYVVAHWLSSKGASGKHNECICCCKVVSKVMKCSGCGIVCYCGPVCQKKDWSKGGQKSHKIQCPKIKELIKMHENQISL